MTAPLPAVVRDDATHRYTCTATGRRYSISVTGVLSALKSTYALDRIEATRDQWQDRGTLIHRAMELHLSTSPFRSWHPDTAPWCWPWIDWIHPLLRHPIWDDVRPIAAEQIVACPILDVAGTFDGAIETINLGKRILIDLKTLGSSTSSTYSTLAQLGGYLVLADRSGLAPFHSAATIWARPNKPPRIQQHSTAACITAWWKAWEAYQHLLDPTTGRRLIVL